MTTKTPFIIYTTDFAGRDEVLCDPIKIPGVRYICFTDRDACDVPSVWEIHAPAKLFDCPRLTNIWHKTHPHVFLPEHDLSLYLNASVELLADPRNALKPGFEGFAAMRHRHRSCLFEEAKYCRDIGVTEPESLRPQLEYYAVMVPPEKRPTGLWETGALIRDNGLPTQVMNALWWEHLFRFPRRDQVVLAFLNTQHQAYFKEGMITDLPGTFSNSEYFKLTSHGGPAPYSETEAFKRFPLYMRRKEQWAERVRQSSRGLDDVVRLV